MRQAQILQAALLEDFFSRLINLSTNELAHAQHDAEETQDGNRIKAIRKEMNNRMRYA